jgi:hypothetical protein
MLIDKGIIDSDNNPFAQESWIQQGFRFTPKRQEQIEKLFGRSAENILMAKPKNDYRYVAFVAVRWSFAKIIKGKLTATEKWKNRHLYDGHGQSQNLNTNS